MIMTEISFWLLLTLVVYTYIGYPVLLYLLRRFYKKQAVTGYSYPMVSVIISAYNEEKHIKDKIETTLSLDYPREKMEILIGSDGSTDSTENIIEGYAARGVKLYKFKERMGKINVLKRLIPVSKGDIIVFSDANTIFEPRAMKEMVRHFAAPAIGCVCGKLVLNKPAGSSGGELETAYWKYETFIKELEGERGALLGANGGIYAVRKELLPALSSNIIIEDFVIPMKILERRFKVVYEPKAVAFEETAKGIVEEGVRKIRIGAGDYQALLMTLPMLNIFRGFPSFAYWSHKVIRWLVPFFLIALILINLFLLQYGSTYQYLFYLQAIFYGGALAGYLLSKRKHQLRLLLTLYYFVAMNASLLMGFFRFISGTQQVTWERAER